MPAETKINRESIRSMVEDFWRSFLATAQSHPETAQDTLTRFEEKIQSLASMMPDEQSEIFIRTITEEREVLFQQYKQSPDALKTRLGLCDPPPTRTETILASDHEAIINAVRRDYADLQVIARSKGSIQELGEKVDRELDLRIRSYVAKMSMDDSAEFQKIYNLEYNKLVMSRLNNKQSQSGCAVIIVAGIGLSTVVGYLGHVLF